LIIDKLKAAGALDAPKWLDASTVGYLTIVGSMAYAVNTDDSDLDVHGFAMPPKYIVFPHTIGIIKGFGSKPPEEFKVFDPHHIKSLDGRTEYDFAVYNIVNYFQLCMGMNPNMVDTLFTADNLVIHRTKISDMVRENRRLFLHKGAWHKFKGYAFAQMSKIKGNANHSNPKRAASTEKFGYDVKFGYHVVRLMLEVEQIMIEGDLDLQRNKEVLKSIRRGEWTLERLEAYFQEKEVALEQVYIDSKLRHSPDEDALRSLLLNCLEEHYGSLAGVVQRDTSVDKVLADLRQVLAKHGD
jgi:predicted nucleotidyltransferase